MVHVFIVNETTFKCHLEYMFAGTGAGDKDATFLQDNNTTLHYSTERNLVGLIADVSRVNIGDKIIFYVEREAKFYGIFEATSKAFFSPANDNYLENELGRKLIFRISIKPFEVYKDGVTEHEYLDSLQGITQVSDMCWSLIYRKLKGGRGCTMITDKEFERLYSLLQENNTVLNGEHFSYDSTTKTIIERGETNAYSRPQLNISIKDRLMKKYYDNYKFEVHLQAYILQTFLNNILGDIFFDLPNATNRWIGNEVGCSVGMQRIDILTIQENEIDVNIKVIELKCGEAYNNIINKQLPWYIQWVNEYLVPTFGNKQIHITPIIITAETSDFQLGQTILVPNTNDNVEIKPVVNISFSVTKNGIEFSIIV